MRVNLARLALVLHGIECFFEPSKNLNIVEAGTIQRAAILVDYYIDQIKLIQGLVQRSGNISGTLLKLYKKLQKTGKITTRDITNSWRNPKDIQGRMNVKKALILMEELASMGKGYLVGKVLYLEDPSGGDGNDGGGSNPPSPIPDNPPNTGIEQQVREQIKEAQLDISPSIPVAEPVLVGVTSGATPTFGAPEGTSMQQNLKELNAESKPQVTGQHPPSPPPESPPIQKAAVAVLEKPPEEQQTRAKGFGQPQVTAKAPPQDDRDDPRFDSFKKTGGLYRIVKDHDNSSVLLTDEFIGFENTSKKIGSVPLKLKSVQCVVERISLEPQIYLVEELRYQNEEGKEVVLNTCPSGQIHSPLIHSHEVPLDQVIVFVYSDGVRDS
ncbi:MAG: DUF3987 domain-containing protein [Moorea sp. SIO4A3]|nr:DUF3987 domain-containing protein [Moorena sp. SIO4A3]